MKTLSRTAIAAVAILAHLPVAGDAVAQSAAELLEEYAEVHQERLEGIDDLLLVQSVLGMTNQTYFEKVVTDGTAILQPQSIQMGGNTMPVEEGASEQFIGDPSAYLVEFAENAEIEGTESIDGAETTVLLIDELPDMEFQAPGQAQGQGPAQTFEPRTMRMFLDTEDWVIRRAEITADAMTANGTAETTVTADFSDFRDVAGLPYPHHMVVSVTGLEGSVSEEELEEARRALAQMRQQLEDMPEQQRQMVENMMGDQMEQLLSTLESGSLSMEMSVEEVRVNEGPPAA